MKRRLTALFLIAAMLLSLLSGCGADAPAEDSPAGSEAIAGASALPEAFTDALKQALILLTDSEHCYAQGIKTLLNDAIPAQVGGTLYIPAAFVAQSLGGTVRQEENKLTVTCNDLTLEITNGTQVIAVNGTEKDFASGAAFTEEGVLVPAEEYCDLLGAELHRRDNLVLIGNGLEAGLNAAEEAEARLVLSALTTELSPRSVAPAGTTYEERLASSYTITIDPVAYPYSTEKDTLIAVAGCLYVENLSVDYVPDRDEYTVEMTVYNYLGYCYGSVEVYDSSGKLKELERIEPYGGQKSSVVSGLTDVAQLAMDTGKAVWNWDISYLTYRTDLNSSSQKIKVAVPKDGYIYITCNPTHSNYVALYNMVYAFVNTAVCLSDIGEAVVGKKDKGGDTVNILVEYILDQLKDDPGLAAEMAAEYVNIFAGREYDIWGFYDNSRAIAEDVLDVFRRAEINIVKLLADGIGSKLSETRDKVVDELLTRLAPITEKPLDTWKVSTSAANLINAFLDMSSVTNCSSVIVDFSDWRTAYCEKLADWCGSGDSFALAYIDDDNIPELLILHAGGRIGSSALIYTYRNRQVVSIPSCYGDEIPMGYGEMRYLPFQGTIIQGNSYEGTTFIDCMVLKDGQFQLECTFEDDAMAKSSGGIVIYKYNDIIVTKSYYELMLYNLGIFPEEDVVSEKYPIPTEWILDRAQIISAYTSGWFITQANLENIYSFPQ